MPPQVQAYVTELLVEILGPTEVEKRFDWCRGDPGKNGRGITLPFDAVWEARKLIVEVDEVQHDKPVRHFDKPGKLTVSGVHRGEQRRLYDLRKESLAGERGYELVRVDVIVVLASKGHRIVPGDRDADRAALLGLLRRQGVPDLSPN